MGYSSGAAAARVAGSLSVAAAGAGSSLAVVAVVAVADFSSAVVAVAVAGSSSAVAAVVVDYKIIKSRYAALPQHTSYMKPATGALSLSQIANFRKVHQGCAASLSVTLL